MASLANFLRDELPRRGWSIPEWAPRAHLSLSNAYLIVRDGKDNVRRDTLDAIAESFGMTTAELMSAIGKGGDLTSDEAQTIALYRQVPTERRSAAQLVLSALGARTDATAHHNTRHTARKRNRSDQWKEADTGLDESQLSLSHGVREFLSSLLPKSDGRHFGRLAPITASGGVE